MSLYYSATLTIMLVKKEKDAHIQLWLLYIVKCHDNTLYTGITTNLEQRIDEHNTSPKGAKYTRSRRPVTLVYSQDFESRSEASKEEYRIKRLTRAQKEALLNRAD